MTPSTRIIEAAYWRDELEKVLDELDARVIALESQAPDEQDPVCARDADDIVRPPGHPLSQIEPKRKERWLLVSNSEYGRSEAYYRERPDWPGAHAMGWTEHQLVEIRDGDVVLSREQATRILRAVQGGPVDPEDIQALEVKP
jgi:hypothetical protein